jgi:drug/metabolite transporter (DMT)-like permease
VFYDAEVRAGADQPTLEPILFLPTSARVRPSPLIWVLFVGLALIWGSSFLFIKIGLNDGLPPLTLVSIRLWIATAFLAVALRLGGGRLLTSPVALRRMAFVAVFNVALPFTLITWGEQHISSAVTGIFNGLVPLFAIVIASLVLHDEPITLNRLGGLLVGFAGVVLLVSPNLGASVGPVDAGMALLGELSVAGGSLSYAVATVFVRHRISGQPLVDDPVRGPRPATPAEVALPQGFIAVLITSCLALLLERPAGGLVTLPAGAQGWFALAWLGMLGSGLAYLLYFRIVTAIGATRTTMVTYLMQVVSLSLGVIVLSEILHPVEVVGAALIIGGLVLANSSVGQRRLFGRDRRVEASSPAGE